MKTLIDKIILVILLLAFLTSIFLIFAWVPPIKASNPAEQIAQRIFYYHVPSAWIGFLAFFVVFIGSIAYLWKRERKYELLSVASAEIGVLFITLVLLTGPVWAKPVWGIWWTWDARLTSSLVLWLIYVAYLMLRRYLPDGNKRANLSAVVGIIGFIDVPIVYYSIRWWETQHPKAVMASSEGGLAAPMFFVFMFSLAAFTLLYVYFMRVRYKLLVMEDSINKQIKEMEIL
ncbi:MAG: cytochrome c biogenesis protein [Candidatus Marinimicrobia bacterium]|nr:cytochrome c biogenesis protein [Candidatus Neomarinimicrobiota bacterium]MCF7851203.1 cytochrome c biogenesis protein [Candidatus Neomarinimicrobiota bacterium]MCF7904139.1 cytochrome c biogenesis protein [Candidatus Neomarinimicrobiota bacterium]